MDERALALAERQHGVVALRQLREIGFTTAAIRHRVESGRWEGLGHGAYRLAGTRRTWEQRLMAAVLAAGPGAVASHRSAGAILGIRGFGRRGVVEITTLRTKRHRDDHTMVHQTREMSLHHITSLDGVPVTRVARTLVDLAGTLQPARTERAIDDCLSSGIVTLDALRDVTADLRRPGRPGIALLGRLLDQRGDGYVAPESELEGRFLRLIGAAGLPAPARQVDVGDAGRWAGRADFAYPELRLLVELDGRRHHGSKLDFEADRAKDNMRVAAGWRPIRFTWAQVTRHPADVVDILLRSGVIPRRPGDARSRRLVG